MEPPVSVPVAAGASRAATAQAEPPDEPPGMRPLSQGCAPVPPRSWPTADSGVLVAGAHGELVAVELAQGHHALRGQLGDHGGVKRRAVALQHARTGGGGKSWVTRMSLCASGTPSRGAGGCRWQCGHRRRGPGPASPQG